MQRSVDWVRGDTLSFAMDESNHGLFPEVYCGIFSKRVKDSSISKFKLEKERKDFSKIVSEVAQRDYSFLVVASKEDYNRIGYEEMAGVVAASLLNGIDTNSFEFLRIILDGVPPRKGKYYFKDIVAESLKIDPERIIFKCGKDFDTKYPLANLADGMARFLHRQKLEDLALNPHQRYILK